MRLELAGAVELRAFKTVLLPSGNRKDSCDAQANHHQVCPAVVDFRRVEMDVSEVSGLAAAKLGETNPGADDLPTRELSVFEKDARGEQGAWRLRLHRPGHYRQRWRGENIPHWPVVPLSEGVAAPLLHAARRLFGLHPPKAALPIESFLFLHAQVSSKAPSSLHSQQSSALSRR